MGYSRKIAYLDLLDQGYKKGNAGFCKWEQRNDRHLLAVLVNGLPRNISGEADICNGQGVKLGSIQVLEGRGESLCHLQEDHNRGEELDSIHIRFPEEIELIAEFQRKHADGVVAETITEKQMEIQTENRTETAIKKQTETSPGKAIRTQPEMPAEIRTEKKPEDPPDLEREKSGDRILFWNKILSSHEIIHPFGTQEEYCRVSLEDIYRLKEEYHVLRNNQFLLHGYYNYHYLILGKKKGEECVYWLGVPGIYHEREKMAARMYGFEKFEGAKPGYRTGDLGYYLITAESDQWIDENE